MFQLNTAESGWRWCGYCEYLIAFILLGYCLMGCCCLVRADDLDALAVETSVTSPTPFLLWLDTSRGMASDLSEVKTQLLEALNQLPDTTELGVAQVNKSGVTVVVAPQLLGAQRGQIATAIHNWSATDNPIDLAQLKNALQQSATVGCVPAHIVLLTANLPSPSVPVPRVSALPVVVQVLELGEQADLWRYFLQSDRLPAVQNQPSVGHIEVVDVASALLKAHAAARLQAYLRSNTDLYVGAQWITSTRIWRGIFQAGYRRQGLGNLQRLEWDWQQATSLAQLSTDQDGLAKAEGSAAEQLAIFPAAKQRRVWTYAGDYQTSSSTGWASLPALNSTANLSAVRNELAWTANQNPVQDQRLQQLMHVTNPQQAADIIRWARGANDWDASSQTRRNWGAVVHAAPLLVNYGFDTQRFTELPADPDQGDNTVFVSTQAGWLHAVDALTLRELFAFMPQELLAELPRLYQQELRGKTLTESGSSETNEPRYSGLDSSWQAWRYEAWQLDAAGNPYLDQQIQSNQGDHVYLIGGMRRGGHNYYGLDVTSANPQALSRTSSIAPSSIEPSLQFVLRGGPFNDVPLNSPYRLLGQTWSVPKLAQVRMGNQVRAVWMFGGGYDAAHYDQPVQNLRIESTSTPHLGSGLYMIDAQSGALLWWAAQQQADTRVAELRHSVVASPKLLDLNQDGLVDRIYWVDLGGQVFRQDIDNRSSVATQPLASRIRVQRFAALGGSQQQDRRFFSAPSVAMLRDNSEQQRVVIALGSGNTEQPQELMVQNRGVVLFDEVTLWDSSVRSTPLAARTFAELLKMDLTSASGVTLTPSMLGWYWELGEGIGAQGEKILSSPLIFNNNLLVSSVLPTAGGTEILCSAQRPLAAQRLYVFDAQTGAATSALQNFRDLGGQGRYLSLSNAPVLGGSLQLLWANQKPVGILVGTQLIRFGQDLLLPDQPLAITKDWRRLQREVLPNRL